MTCRMPVSCTADRTPPPLAPPPCVNPNGEPKHEKQNDDRLLRVHDGLRRKHLKWLSPMLGAVQGGDVLHRGRGRAVRARVCIAIGSLFGGLIELCVTLLYFVSRHLIAPRTYVCGAYTSTAVFCMFIGAYFILDLRNNLFINSFIDELSLGDVVGLKSRGCCKLKEGGQKS